ncbi:ATP-binding protein [Breoghania sp. L-A4]|uniref:ATP-binding protein n=1 Tax=Breoghania sp. L-A4 TaxID=2304600 RepID=UPI0013C32110|nr:ATP-binding protein [Breoghania sp. L-A4]
MSDAPHGTSDSNGQPQPAAPGEAGQPDTALALAVIVHDIRTPLGAISATADLLAAGPLNPIQTRYVDTLRQAAAALNDLAGELLEEAGEVSPEPRSPMVWNPREFLTSIGAMFSAQAHAKNVRFETDIADALGFPAEGDPNAVRRILSNLLDNAIKFTKHGAVRLSAALTNDGRSIEIRVSDEGPGIAPDELAELFTPYTQGASGMNLQRGSGLGLWISKTLATRLQGTLDVSSTPGQGTCFSLRIPCPRLRGGVADVADTDAAKQQVVRKGLPLGLNVLVVDDNAINRLLITTFLESFGMRFYAVTSGPEAIDAIAQQPFDAVIMDLQMPDMDGIETAALMRESESRLPIIALTAGMRPTDTKRLRKADFCATLGKPFAPADLLQALTKAAACE